MSENRGDDVKNIGDAGDSSKDSLEIPETLDSPVYDMVKGIKHSLQCGDHQGLKMMLGKLETWKQGNRDDLVHDYWRVAQYIGETEMNSMYVLLSVTCDKPENVKCSYLNDALSVLALSLCNREIIFKLLVYANNLTPILVMALEQDCKAMFTGIDSEASERHKMNVSPSHSPNAKWCEGKLVRCYEFAIYLYAVQPLIYLILRDEEVNSSNFRAIRLCLQNDEVTNHALTIINLTVTVCRARFARGLLNAHFLNKLVERMLGEGPSTTLKRFDLVLQVIKSFLMCGQSYIHTYAMEVLSKLAEFATAMSCWDCPAAENKKRDEVVDFYHELLRSIDNNEKPHICAKYWTRGRLRKDLLSECLGQPWLYIYCSWPACGNHNAIPNTFFRKCGVCNVVRYCSRQCQIRHWETGHNNQCKFISSLGKTV